MKMCDKSFKILSILRKIRSIESQTIDSLISYGFDSNQTINALNIDSDLPQMTDISIQQKLILRKVFSELKVSLKCDLISFKFNETNKYNKEMFKSSDNEMSHFVDRFLSHLYEKDFREKQMKQFVEEAMDRIGLIKDKVKLQRNAYISQINENEDTISDELNQRFYPKTCELMNENAVKQDLNSNTCINTSERVVDHSLISEDIKTDGNQSDNGIDSNEVMINKYIENHSNRFKCSFNNCGKIMDQLCEIKSHIKRHLVEKPFKCRFYGCDFQSVFTSDLKQHIRGIHQSIDELKCNECNTCFSTKYELRCHQSKAHPICFSFDCKECGKHFNRKDELKKHVAKHLNKNKKYKCHYTGCDHSFFTHFLLKRHINSVHKNKTKLNAK